MLSQIIKEIERADGAIDLNELSWRLGVQRSALDGMIETLVRKGRLREVDTGGGMSSPCAHCAGRATCTVVGSGKIYEVVRQE